MTAEERRARECKHPFVWPNGDCVQCGVLATTMPGHTEPTHIMVPRYFAPLLSAAEQAARKEERELCCKDVCEGCAKGIKFVDYAPNKLHQSHIGDVFVCKAASIRNRE